MTMFLKTQNKEPSRGKNPGPIAQGKLNFALGQVKIEVQWPNLQVIFASVVCESEQKYQFDKS